MIGRGADGLWRSSLLEAAGGIEHSFGTARVRPAGGYLLLKQVHSRIVVAAGDWAEGMEGDGLHTSERGLRIGVKTADCVPLILYDGVRGAVAAVHSGWKGTVAGIAGAAVEAMGAAYGTRAEDLWVALGPAIGGCCFEVGPEVACQFGALFPERDDLGGKVKVDLREAVRRQLVGAGVRGERVDGVEGPCTYCGGREFYSWRRDRVAGERMYAVAGLV